MPRTFIIRTQGPELDWLTVSNIDRWLEDQIDNRHYTVQEVYVTKTGRVLFDADIEALEREME